MKMPAVKDFDLYEIDTSISFHDYKYEQQGEMMEDLVYERERSPNYKSQKERDLEAIISQALPLNADTEATAPTPTVPKIQI